jgi:hypothetical protein
MLFKIMPLDAKFDEIKDCFDPSKYIFPSKCEIRISLLEEVEKKKQKRINEEKLRRAVRYTLVKGLITDREKETLRSIKEKLGISTEIATRIFSEEVLKRTIRYALSANRVSDTGKIEWEKLRKKLDIPKEQASRLFSEEFLGEIIKGILTDSTTPEAKTKKLRELNTKLSKLGLSQERARQIFEEEKLKISSPSQKEKKAAAKESKKKKDKFEKEPEIEKKTEVREEEKIEQLKEPQKESLDKELDIPMPQLKKQKDMVNKPGKIQDKQEKEKDKDLNDLKVPTGIPTSPRKPAHEQEEEIEPIDASQAEMFARITTILEDARNKGLSNLYVVPNIPKKMELNAWKKCKMHKEVGEDIIGILDMTIKESAKKCLVFGKNGMYFYNPPFGQRKRRGKILYRTIRDSNLYVVDKGKFNLKLGDENILNTRTLGSFAKNCLKDTIEKIFALFHV